MPADMGVMFLFCCCCVYQIAFRYCCWSMSLRNCCCCLLGAYCGGVCTLFIMAVGAMSRCYWSGVVMGWRAINYC